VGVNVDLSALFGLVDDLFTSEEEKMAAKLKFMELQQKGQLAQITVNTEEAKHSSVFVSGWRPAIGWVCGAAFTWHFVALPIVVTLCTMFGVPFVPPVFEMQALLTVLGGMLGLGTMRSFEKVNGVARSTLNPATDTVDRSGKR